MRVFSNLDLNGETPVRVQPAVGEWGPQDVPSTGAKKRMRLWVVLAFVGVLTALCLLGWYFYKALNGLS